MKTVPFFLFALAPLVFAAGCASAPRETPKPPPYPKRAPAPKSQAAVLEAHLRGDWIHGATRLQAADAVIYYRGTAQRDSAEDAPWTGTVQGDILFATPNRAIVIPSGTLTLGPHGAIKIVGPASTFLVQPGEPASWRNVLSM